MGRRAIYRLEAAKLHSEAVRVSCCVVLRLHVETDFSFLALDPHPYADTLYWATDGRQLVIAQPDKVGRSALYSPDTDHSSSRRYFPSSSSMTSYRRLAAS